MMSRISICVYTVFICSYQQLVFGGLHLGMFSNINYLGYENNQPASSFHNTYFDHGIAYLSDIFFCLDNLPSGITKIYWAHHKLSGSVSKGTLVTLIWVEFDPMNFTYEQHYFLYIINKVKQFYSLLISDEAKHPSSADLDLTNSSQEVFSITYTVASETYVCSFQCRTLKHILFTNAKIA